MCPHEAVPLEEGIHDGPPDLHGAHVAVFDLKTGAPWADAQEGLKEYTLKEKHGDLYIALEAEPGRSSAAGGMPRSTGGLS